MFSFSVPQCVENPLAPNKWYGDECNLGDMDSQTFIVNGLAGDEDAIWGDCLEEEGQTYTATWSGYVSTGVTGPYTTTTEYGVVYESSPTSTLSGGGPDTSIASSPPSLGGGTQTDTTTYGVPGGAGSSSTSTQYPGGSSPTTTAPGTATQMQDNLSTESPGVCTNCKTANAQFNTLLVSVNVDHLACPKPYFDIGMVKFCADGATQAKITFHQLISEPLAAITDSIVIDPVRAILFAFIC